jgi:hypothetical protein
MRVETQEAGRKIIAERGERLDDCEPAMVRDVVQSQGWAYFSGFGASLEESDVFVHRFGRAASPRLIPGAPGELPLGFHAEDACNAWRPDVLWFVCLEVGSAGGTPTDVVDGVELLASMDEHWREFSLANSICFHQWWPAEQWQRAITPGAMAEATEFLDSLPGLKYDFLPNGDLYTRTFVPITTLTQAGQQSFSNTMLHAVMQPDYYGMTMADESEVPQDLVDHVEKIALARRIPLGWQKGDVAVIDNYRLMHRRGIYTGTGRDLRVMHGEEFYGSHLPETPTPVTKALKEVLQGELDLR